MPSSSVHGIDNAPLDRFPRELLDIVVKDAETSKNKTCVSAVPQTHTHTQTHTHRHTHTLSRPPPSACQSAAQVCAEPLEAAAGCKDFVAAVDEIAHNRLCTRVHARGWRTRVKQQNVERVLHTTGGRVKRWQGDRVKRWKGGRVEGWRLRGGGVETMRHKRERQREGGESLLSLARLKTALPPPQHKQNTHIHTRTRTHRHKDTTNLWRVIHVVLPDAQENV